MDLFVSRIYFNKRLSYTVIKTVNKKIVDTCKKNGILFIDNGNILTWIYTKMDYTYWKEVNTY